MNFSRRVNEELILALLWRSDQLDDGTCHKQYHYHTNIPHESESFEGALQNRRLGQCVPASSLPNSRESVFQTRLQTSLEQVYRPTVSPLAVAPSIESLCAESRERAAASLTKSNDEQQTT
jgi:hypothetical protein